MIICSVFISELLEFVASLGNSACLSSDCVSFSLLLLNLISSTFHNQSKNRRQNSSFEKYNASWYIFPFYLLFYNFFLISDCEINYTKLFYSNFWTVYHLFSVRKTFLYIPDSTNFLAELTAKQLTKQRELQASLKGWKLSMKLMHHCSFWLDVQSFLHMKVQSFTIILIGHNIIFFICIKHC